ncbi:hypothetical protein M5689_018545 [Euphorbia peplus]|nr:hypothetical protein M5689_018545 [Euphorbia peplus]
MGRQNGDAKVATSSIALLQERFRELQKIKEKRQQKQLLKLFSSQSDNDDHHHHHHQTPPPLSSMAMHNSPNQDSLLSLGLNSQTHNNYGVAIINSNTQSSSSSSSFSSLWPNSATSSSRNGLEYSDVDTSLHL